MFNKKSNFRCFKAILFCGLSVVAMAEEAIKPKKLNPGNWHMASTKNFIIVSDDREKKIIKLAENLEKFRKTVKVTGGFNISSSDRPIKIIAPRSKTAFKAIAGETIDTKTYAGFFKENINGNYSVLKTEVNRYGYNPSLQTLYHEYLHYLVAQGKASHFPRWYNEGLADYLSTMEFEENGQVNLGKPNAGRINSLNYGPGKTLTVEQLIKTTSMADFSKGEVSKFYAKSWLLTHYLNSDKELSKQLIQFISMLEDNKDIDTAFEQSFTVSYSDLDNAIRKYARRPSFSYSQFNFKGLEDIGDIAIRRLTEEELYFEVGEFFLNAVSLEKKAETLFKRSIEINPDYADALAGLANIQLFSDVALAKKTIDQAILLEPESTFANIIKGHVYQSLVEVDEKGKTDNMDNVIISLKAYAKALAKQPSNLEAMDAAATLYNKLGRSEKAIELLEAAGTYAPSLESIQARRIWMYYKTEQRDKAEPLMDIIKANPHISEQWLENFEKRLTKNFG